MWIQTIFKDENVWKKHGSISGYIHGMKHDVQIVNFFLKYDDKKAKLAMEENIYERDCIQNSLQFLIELKK